MSKILISLLTLAVLLGAAEDPWDKVRQIQSGSELRVYKKGAQKPLQAKMDQATPNRLMVVVKNAQVSIAKDEVDRIDARPSGRAQVTREDKRTVKMESPDPTQPGTGSPGITESTSSSASLSRSKQNYETIYRRPSAK